MDDIINEKLNQFIKKNKQIKKKEIKKENSNKKAKKNETEIVNEKELTIEKEINKSQIIKNFINFENSSGKFMIKFRSDIIIGFDKILDNLILTFKENKSNNINYYYSFNDINKNNKVN